MSRISAGKPLTQTAERYLGQLQAKWSGSLHLCMLGTPLRYCVVSSNVMPTALLLQLKLVELHPDSVGGDASRHVMLPSQILHPDFVWRKRGKGFWITLHPTILKSLHQRKQYKMLNPAATLAPDFATLVHRQLGQRVVQEAQLLKAESATLVRSFATQDEVETYRDSCQVPPSFVLGSREFTSAPDPCNSTSIPPLVFQPRLLDESQNVDLASHLSVMGGNAPYHVFAQSAATAPLGIALYRLHLWTRSLPHP